MKFTDETISKAASLIGKKGKIKDSGVFWTFIDYNGKRKAKEQIEARLVLWKYATASEARRHDDSKRILHHLAINLCLRSNLNR